MSDHIYALIIKSEKAAFFGLAATVWSQELIDGEGWSPLTVAADIGKLLSRLNHCINDGTLSRCELHVLYDDTALPLLDELSPTLGKLQCKNWQLLRLQLLLKRAGHEDQSWPDDAWLAQTLLPALQSTWLNPKEDLLVKKKQAEVERQLKAQMEKLEQGLEAKDERIKELQKKLREYKREVDKANASGRSAVNETAANYRKKIKELEREAGEWERAVNETAKSHREVIRQLERELAELRTR